jgi:hypothetical protein
VRRFTNVVGKLARQFVIGETLARDLSGYFEKPVGVFTFALVESKNLPVKVAEQMERLDRNISAFEAALEKRPEVLNPVRVNLPVNVLPGVVNNLMDVFLMQTAIAFPSVREELRARLDVVSHFGVKRKLRSVPNHLALTLPSRSRRPMTATLPAPPVPRNLPAMLAPVHVAGEAADVCFVGFHLTAHLLLKRTRLHRNANPVKHEPSGLLRDADCAMDFVTAHTVFAVSDHPNRSQPLVKAKRRVFKNRSRFNRELTASVCALALPLALIRQKANVLTPARRADNAIRPAARDHVVKAVVGVREIDNRFLQRLGYLLLRHSEASLANQS